jgi:septum formation protein
VIGSQTEGIQAEAQVILASASPRRRALLSRLGVTFMAAAADIDEQALPGEPPDELVIRLSQGKAAAVAAAVAETSLLAVVLAADTVVVLDNRILGKPTDPTDAVVMLRALRGRVHQVYTAVSVADARSSAAGGRTATRLSCSSVWMRAFTDEEVDAYVATGDPLDKAGAYAIQHPQFAPVDHWEGCYTGIMGLPLGITADMLRAVGVMTRADALAVCEESSGRCCLRGDRGGCQGAGAD